MHACYDLKKDVYFILAQVDSEFIAGAKTLNTNVPESKWVQKRQKIYKWEIRSYLFLILKKAVYLGDFLSLKKEK